MTVRVCSIENLPDWVDRQFLSDNGSGKDYANYLVIEDGEHRACYSDAMEIEDCRFTRDLDWIKTELERLKPPTKGAE